MATRKTASRPVAKIKKTGKLELRLYVAGAAPRSTRAIAHVRKLCDQFLAGRHQLEVIDVYQQPELAREGQMIAAPTLVKSFPLPLRRFIGDMSNTANLLAGLDVPIAMKNSGTDSENK